MTQLSTLEPAVGSLLIADPFMQDPHFERSVILICKHDDEGTFGLVLNNRTDFNLSNALPNPEFEDFELFSGGPVLPEGLSLLHRIDSPDVGGLPVVPGVFCGGEIDFILDLVQRGLVDWKELKFFFGYSGWEPGQLDREMKENSWTVHQNYNPDLLFLLEEEDLWKQTLISMGPKYAHVAKFPKSPNWN